MAFALYIERLFEPIRDLTGGFGQLTRSLVAADRVFEILDVRPVRTLFVEMAVYLTQVREVDSMLVGAIGLGLFLCVFLEPLVRRVLMLPLLHMAAWKSVEPTPGGGFPIRVMSTTSTRDSTSTDVTEWRAWPRS